MVVLNQRCKDPIYFKSVYLSIVSKYFKPFMFILIL